MLTTCTISYVHLEGRSFPTSQFEIFSTKMKTRFRIKKANTGFTRNGPLRINKIPSVLVVGIYIVKKKKKKNKNNNFHLYTDLFIKNEFF